MARLESIGITGLQPVDNLVRIMIKFEKGKNVRDIPNNKHILLDFTSIIILIVVESRSKCS